MRRRAEMLRITRDELFMSMAELIGKRSTCVRKNVGAVIIRDSRSISMGYNGAPAGLPHCTEVGCELDEHESCIRTIHAESNAIAFAARSGISTDGATLYITMAPCYSCAKLIINAGIQEVIYSEDYHDPKALTVLRAVGILVTRYTGQFMVRVEPAPTSTRQVLPIS